LLRHPDLSGNPPGLAQGVFPPGGRILRGGHGWFGSARRILRSLQRALGRAGKELGSVTMRSRMIREESRVGCNEGCRSPGRVSGGWDEGSDRPGAVSGRMRRGTGSAGRSLPTVTTGGRVRREVSRRFRSEAADGAERARKRWKENLILSRNYLGFWEG